MSPFKIGDYVGHKLKQVVAKMTIFMIKDGEDYWFGQWRKRLEVEEKPIGCRWWDEGAGMYWREWFGMEELELWRE